MVTCSDCGVSQGGGYYIRGTNVTMFDCDIHGNLAEISGGGAFIAAANLSIHGCAFSFNSAGDKGGGLYAQTGSILLSDGTLFISNSALSGSTLINEVAAMAYTLPVPEGHYISATICLPTFVSCPSRLPCLGQCSAGDITLNPTSATDPNDCGARPPYVIQACPWDRRVDSNAFGTWLLNQNLQPLLPGSFDLIKWPVPCPPGYLGAERDNKQGQTSSLCAGLCPRGYYCPSPATVVPIICPTGHFCPAGTSLPWACPYGTFSNATLLESDTDCTPCPPGSACSTGVLSPTPCTPGRFAASPRSSDCSPCPGGTFQAEINATQCSRCTRGSYCLEGSSASLLCPAGTYSNATNLAYQRDCDRCPAGSSCPAGSHTPSKCPPGFFQAETGSSSCISCPKGRFQSTAGSTACEQCPTRTYTSISGAVTCSNCLPHLSSFPGSEACNVCDVGFYRRDAQTVPLTETCTSCDLLEGGECALNTTVDTISVLPGYWRHSGRATLIYKCEGPDALDRCLGGSDAGVDGQRYCSTNRTGPECQICNDGFYSDRSGACSECPDLGAFLAAMYLLLIAAILVVACCFLTALLHPAVQQIAVMRGIYLLVGRLQFYCKSMNLVSKMKILFSFYGVVTVIDETYDAKLPPVYTSWLHDAFSWATMDWPSLFFSLECSPLPALSMSSFRLWLLVRALTPLIFVLLAIFVGSVFKFFLSGKTLAGVKQGILSSTPLLLVVIFAFVPSVSMHIFRSWLCVEYQIDAADASHISYLVHDLHVQCNGNEEHNEYDHVTRTAFALIWIWPVGSVLMYFAVLLPCRFSLRSHVPRPLLWATKFLHKDYRIDFFYWEVIELVRRTVIVGWVLLIPTSESFLRLVVALLLSIASLTLLLTFQPYKMPADNVLAGLCQLTIVIVFIGATYTRLYEQISILNGGAEAQRVMIFSSTDIIALPLVIMTAGMSLAMVLIMATHLYNEGMLYTIQLKETKKLPELTYYPRKKWHLFLSHVWGTGQDANATIKRQMQRLLTGISVFLDVDDLHELDLLETYIDQSMAVSFFLSRGYFKSLNCMREVRATICGQKPLKLIQETDTSKGGGEVDAVKLELDDAELTMAIFCANRIITPWYRVMEFQLVSLKKILGFTLLQTPSYKNRTELSLCIPGEASLEKIILKRPVHIYASVYNAGAKNFAMELQEVLPSLKCSDDKESVYAQPNEVPSDAYFLVYLNSETFSGEDGRKFADEIWELCFGCKPQQYNKLGSKHPRTALSAPLPIILVHENDHSRNGCDFSRFFTSTPAKLIENGLYAKLAIPAYPANSYRAVSLYMVGQTVAQNHDSTGCFSRPSNLLQWRIQLRKSQRIAQAVGKRVVQAVALPDLSEESAQKGTSDPQIGPKSV